MIDFIPQEDSPGGYRVVLRCGALSGDSTTPLTEISQQHTCNCQQELTGKGEKSGKIKWPVSYTLDRKRRAEEKDQGMKPFFPDNEVDTLTDIQSWTADDMEGMTGPRLKRAIQVSKKRFSRVELQDIMLSPPPPGVNPGVDGTRFSSCKR